MGKKHEKAFHLDMPFEEALGRFARTDPGEVPEAKPKKEKVIKAHLKARNAAPLKPHTTRPP